VVAGVIDTEKAITMEIDPETSVGHVYISAGDAGEPISFEVRPPPRVLATVADDLSHIVIAADDACAEKMARRLYEITLAALEEHGAYSPLLMPPWDVLPPMTREVNTEVCRRLMLEGIPLPEPDND